MEFHSAKCQALQIIRSRKPLRCSCVLHGHTLDMMTVANYLGLNINQEINWDDHINDICDKLRQTRLWAYKAFVRPLLEYASSVWDPYTQRNIDRIEAVQRRAARFVLNRHRNTSSVSSMLEALDWPTLESRRQKARLSMLHKIRVGLVHCPSLQAKLVPLPSRQRRGHDQQFCLIPSRTKYRGSSFLPRTIRDWNGLTHEALRAVTLDTPDVSGVLA
eukprot:TRINITY_DN45450_c0_g1_i15.p1 TRINITY_DN45450_c0_g1~~TRINITY_DN45450_c0_g1_i15.p1  ORF type:complete len:218 (-),score=38.33 TRINITY_DN45450_c0_g1_i15:57-710(-)